jgi:hypothetical protein
MKHNGQQRFLICGNFGDGSLFSDIALMHIKNALRQQFPDHCLSVTALKKPESDTSAQVEWIPWSDVSTLKVRMQESHAVLIADLEPWQTAARKGAPWRFIPALAREQEKPCIHLSEFLNNCSDFHSYFSAFGLAMCSQILTDAPEIARLAGATAVKVDMPETQVGRLFRLGPRKDLDSFLKFCRISGEKMLALVFEHVTDASLGRVKNLAHALDDLIDAGSFNQIIIVDGASTLDRNSVRSLIRDLTENIQNKGALIDVGDQPVGLKCSLIQSATAALGFGPRAAAMIHGLGTPTAEISHLGVDTNDESPWTRIHDSSLSDAAVRTTLQDLILTTSCANNESPVYHLEDLNVDTVKAWPAGATRESSNVTWSALSEAANNLQLTAQISELLQQQEEAQSSIKRLRRDFASSRKLLDEKSTELTASKKQVDDLTNRTYWYNGELMRLQTSSQKTPSGLKFRIAKDLPERIVLKLFPIGSAHRKFFRKMLGRTDLIQGGHETNDSMSMMEKFCAVNPDKETVAIFTATKFIEDEGQRTVHFAKQFVALGYRVVFVYWRWQHDSECEQLPLESGMLKIPIDLALKDSEGFVSTLTTPNAIALLAFPLPELFPLIAATKAKGWQTVYDILDDWEEFHKVGQAIWYDKGFEQHYFRFADHRFAVNEILREKVSTLGFPSLRGGTTVHVNRNGLKEGIDVVDQSRTLDRGEVTLGFFGYLANGWFNWELVNEVARMRPQWKIYIIGYGQDPEETPPPNVHMLGRKRQTELASYAENWDVGIIPFIPNPLSEGADPIKTYEYFAMDLPVVASGVEPPPGAEGLYHRADSSAEFVLAVEKSVANRDQFTTKRAEFAARSTWRHRVEEIIETMSLKPADATPMHDYLFGGTP